MKSETKVDLAEALCSISPAVRDAFTKSHEALLDAGIPHILIGGLAVKAGLDVPAVRSELVRIVIGRNATETKQLTRVLSLFDRCIEAAASE